MLMDVWTFKLNYGGNTYPITPRYKELNIESKKETGYIFPREKLTVKLRLYGDDAERIINEGVTTKFSIDIYKNDVFYKNVFFYKYNCEIDFEKKKVEIQKFKNNDDYTYILDSLNKTYKATDLLIPPVTFKFDKQMYYQIYVSGSNRVFCYQNDYAWDEEIADTEFNEADLTALHNFNSVNLTEGGKAYIRIVTANSARFPVKSDDPIGTSQGYDFIATASTSSIVLSNEYTDAVNEYGKVSESCAVNKYFKIPDQTIEPVYQIKYYAVLPDYWGCQSIWYKFNEFEYSSNIDAEKTTQTTKGAYKTTSVIDALLKKINPSYSLNTDFTGVINSRLIDRALITQISNVTKGTTDTPATKGDVSLGLFFKFFKALGYDWVIENNVVSFIHFTTYYPSGDSVNLDNIYHYSTNTPVTLGYNMVKYDDMEFIHERVYMTTSEGSPLFKQTSIYFSDEIAEEGSKQDISITGLFTDLENIQSRKNKYPSDGWVIAVTDYDAVNDYYTASYESFPDFFKVGEVTEIRHWNIQNAQFAMINLYAENLLYDMQSFNFTPIFYYPPEYTVAKRKTQSMKQEIEVSGLNLNVNDIVTTSIGEGRVDEIKGDLVTGKNKITIKYDAV